MVVELLYAFLLGILSILSPCTFIIIPLMTTEIHSRLSRILKFMIGIVITFSALGVLSGLTGKLLTNFIGPYLYLLAAIVTSITGLNMLDVFRLNIPSLFPSYKTRNLFILGLIYGGVILSCIGPLLAVILVYIVAEATIFYGFIMMLFYSLGFITPFILFGILITDKNIALKMMKHSAIIRKIGGVLLLLVSVYLFYLVSRGLI